MTKFAPLWPPPLRDQRYVVISHVLAHAFTHQDEPVRPVRYKRSLVEVDDHFNLPRLMNSKVCNVRFRSKGRKYV